MRVSSPICFHTDNRNIIHHPSNIYNKRNMWENTYSPTLHHYSPPTNYFRCPTLTSTTPNTLPLSCVTILPPQCQTPCHQAPPPQPPHHHLHAPPSSHHNAKHLATKQPQNYISLHRIY